MKIDLRRYTEQNESLDLEKGFMMENLKKIDIKGRKLKLNFNQT